MDSANFGDNNSGHFSPRVQPNSQTDIQMQLKTLPTPAADQLAGVIQLVHRKPTNLLFLFPLLPNYRHVVLQFRV